MKQILIVEDEIATRRLLAKFVREAGHAVLQATDGRSAWEFLREHSDIDLLITDIVIPDMNGFKLIEEIRNDAALEKLPIIVVSGHAEEKDSAKLLDEGPTALITKPVNRSDLKGHLRQLL
jgi:CheY-like chemotaxis protein